MDSTDNGTLAFGHSAEAARLERSVQAVLTLIATAQDERRAPPVQAARRNLAAVYGLTRLRRREERRQRVA